MPEPSFEPVEPRAVAADDRYDAFVSYKRSDIEFARRLDKALNAYRPPRTLDVPQRRLRVFRDEGDLTGPEYFAAIDGFLARSERLIVLGSPAARASEFVNDEIRRFVRHRGAANILPVLVAGLPNNEAGPDRAAEQAFPQALTEAFELPLAIDYRGFDPRRDKVQGGRFEGRWYSLLAGLYGRSRDEVEQRERMRQRRQRNIWLGLGAAVTASLATLALVAWIQKLEADRQRDVALRGLARYLVNVAQARRADQPQDALLLAVEAVRTTRDVDRSVTPEALNALRWALAGASGEPLGGRAGRTRAVQFDASTSHAATLDDDDTVAVWDLAAAERPRWTLPPAASGPRRLLALSTQARWLVLGEGEPQQLVLQPVGPAPDAAIRLSPRGGPGEKLLALSDDGRWLATADDNATVRVWSLEDPAAAPRVLAGHRSRRNSDGQPLGVHQAVFAPDSTWLFTSAWDRSGRMWNLAEPAAPGEVLPDADGLATGRFSPDGRWFVQRTDDGFGQRAARLALRRLDGNRWVEVDWPGGRAVAAEGAKPAPPPSVIGFADEPLRLLTQHDGEVRAWEPGSAAAPRRIAGAAGVVSSDGGSLAVVVGRAGAKGVTVQVHDLRNADADARDAITLDAPPKAMRLAPDASALALLTDDGRPVLVDLDARFPEPAARLRAKERTGDLPRFSADGRWMVAGGTWGDFTLRRWRIENPSTDPVRIETFAPPELAYKTSSGGGSGTPSAGLSDALAIDPTGKWLAVPGPGTEAWLVSLDDPNRAPRVFRGSTHRVTAIAFTADGKRLVGADWGHAVRLWSLDDPATPLQVLQRPPGERASSVSALAVSADGRWIATGGESGDIALWDLAAREAPARLLRGHRGWVVQLAFAADSRTLFSAGSDGVLKRWRPDAAPEASPLDLAKHQKAVIQLRVVDGGRRVVSAGADAVLQVSSDADPPQPPLVLRGHEDELVALAVDPSGRWIASGGDDAQLRLWDLERPGAAPQQLGQRQAPISTVALSADGRWLASGEHGGRVRLWDRHDLAADPVLLDTREGDERVFVWGLRFSADGRWLIGMANSRLHLWRLRLDEQLALACRIAGRNIEHGLWQAHLAGVPYRLTCPDAGLPARWLEQADELARRAQTARASGMYTTARRIVPSLTLDPAARARAITRQSLLDSARSAARRGERDAALAMFSDASRLDPAQPVDATAEIDAIGKAKQLQREASDQARRGVLDAAIAKFREAKALDPGIDVADAERAARALWAPTLERRGDELARDGRLDEAIAQYEAALAHGLRSSMEPAEQARNVRGDALVTQGRTLARDGRLDDAVRTFEEALRMKPALRLEPATEARKGVAEHRVAQADKAIRERRSADAAALYREAIGLDPEVRISAWTLNELCWSGVTASRAREMLDLCELAVAKSPDDVKILDSRGMARALVGERDGAIADLTAYAERALRDDPESKAGLARRRVVEQLRGGARFASFADLARLGVTP